MTRVGEYIDGVRWEEGGFGAGALCRKAGRPRLIRRVCYPLRCPLAAFVLPVPLPD